MEMIDKMSILSCGDIHGRNNWMIPTFGSIERFYKWQNDPADDKDYPFNKYEKIVFIGDYCDSFNLGNVDILHNLKQIIAFKKAYPDRVILLIGNHDFNYFARQQYTCKGYRPEAFYDLNVLLNDNIDLFQVAYQYESWLWTHGGLTKTYLEHCVLPMREKQYRFHSVTKNMSIVELLNFMFVANNPELNIAGASSQGYSLFPSVLWARPEDLDSDPIDLNQIVGHTHCDDVRIVNIDDKVEHVYIDCLANNKWHILKLQTPAYKCL